MISEVEKMVCRRDGRVRTLPYEVAKRKNSLRKKGLSFMLSAANNSLMIHICQNLGITV